MKRVDYSKLIEELNKQIRLNNNEIAYFKRVSKTARESQKESKFFKSLALFITIFVVLCLCSAIPIVGNFIRSLSPIASLLIFDGIPLASVIIKEVLQASSFDGVKASEREKIRGKVEADAKVKALENKNEALSLTISALEDKERTFNRLLEMYNIEPKKLDGVEALLEKKENLTETLYRLYSELEEESFKSTISKEFFDVRDKYEKYSKFFLWIIVGGIAGLIFGVFPVMLTSFAKRSFYMLLVPFLSGALVSGSLFIKRFIDRFKVFAFMNKKLDKNGLPYNAKVDTEFKSLDKSVQKIIGDIYSVALAIQENDEMIAALGNDEEAPLEHADEMALESNLSFIQEETPIEKSQVDEKGKSLDFKPIGQ